MSGSHEPLSVLRVEANGGNIILRANRDEPNGKDGVVVEGSPDTTVTYIHSHILKKYFDEIIEEFQKLSKLNVCYSGDSKR